MPIRKITRNPKTQSPQPDHLPSAGTKPAIRPRVRPVAHTSERSGPGNEAAGVEQEPDADEGYTVGYGKPPVHSRFKKGRSGNPNGRARDSRNEKTLVNDILGARVTIGTPQGPRRLNSYQISLMKLREKAAQGDLRAIKEVLGYFAKVSDDADHARQTDQALSSADREILRYLLGSPDEVLPADGEGDHGHDD